MVLPDRPSEPPCAVRLPFLFNYHISAVTSSLFELDTSPCKILFMYAVFFFLGQYYVKTGKCKFGANCIFHHPKDVSIPSTGCETGMGELFSSPKTGVTNRDLNPAQAPVLAPALRYNSKGLPIRLVILCN